MIIYQAVRIHGVERHAIPNATALNVTVEAEQWGHPENTVVVAIDYSMLKRLREYFGE